MAFPFGGHPTLAAYIQWARGEGCHAQSGYAADDLGKTHPTTRIYIDGGKSVIVPGVGQQEYLTPTMVGYLDRRLGINSPWFSVEPEED